MMFFEITTVLRETREELSREEKQEHAASLQPIIDGLFEKSQRRCHITVTSAFFSKTKVTLCAAVKTGHLTSDIVEDFFAAIDLRYAQYEINEITMESYASMLRASERYGYIEVKEEIAEKLQLKDFGLFNHRGARFSETVLTLTPTKSELVRQAAGLLCMGNLLPELERIYQGAAIPNIVGHPVHYMIETDNRELRNQMQSILLTALYQNGRIKSRRYCEVNCDAISSPSEKELDSLYTSCQDGTVIVIYDESDKEDSDLAHVGIEVINTLCSVMRKYRNSVLTIFCLPRSCENNRGLLYEHLGAVTMVRLGEETVFGEHARAYLRSLAEKHGIESDAELFHSVADDKTGHSATDLNIAFDEWYDMRMKTCVYTQYAALETANRHILLEKPKGSAYEDLHKLVGLTNVKKIIKQVIDYHKAQKLFREKGIVAERPAMQMLFTGNPGTAKTTVARLLAQIMKDNGLLSVGDLHEIGRADLVGKYVGWTAQIVKKKFSAAKGSILFIDEAYSLVEKDGLYGDEAINTIVQEMENHRSDMVVILAGYPGKMEELLQKNPGLRSRIAFHVPFADYDADELFQITDLLAKKRNVALGGEVREKLSPIFDRAMKQEGFGNGRFARNLFEKALMKQAGRLVATESGSVTRSDVELLIAEDFDEPAVPCLEKRLIGFESI